jgi:aspartyl-tRNA(Asn)/glutamyl-tRNA(Gln) amidotransferase subunit B
MGLPGSLPKINKKAVEYALKVAKAFHCEVAEEAEFARKNYFYPDLPKGFQITMYDHPIGTHGFIEIEGYDVEKRIRITRIHLEEDPGRLVHKGGGDRPRYSLVDYNRSGIPLLEIVTEPDLRSPQEARKLLNNMRTTLEYLKVLTVIRKGHSGSMRTSPLKDNRELKSRTFHPTKVLKKLSHSKSHASIIC